MHHCLLHPIMLLHKPEQVFANAVAGSTPVSVQNVYIYIHMYIFYIVRMAGMPHVGTHRFAAFFLGSGTVGVRP